MYTNSAEQATLTAVIPRNYARALRARAEREDRSMSAVVRAALSAHLFSEAELHAPANSVRADK
jgi:plasmid stability protein